MTDTEFARLLALTPPAAARRLSVSSAGRIRTDVYIVYTRRGILGPAVTQQALRHLQEQVQALPAGLSSHVARVAVTELARVVRP